MFVYFNRLLFKSISLLPPFTLSPSSFSSLFFLFFPLYLSPLLFLSASLPPSFSFYPFFSYPSIPSNLSIFSYLLFANFSPISFRSLLSLVASFPSNPLFLADSFINPTPSFFYPSIPSYPSFPPYPLFPSYPPPNPSYLSFPSIPSYLSFPSIPSYHSNYSFPSFPSYPSFSSYPSCSSSPFFLHIPPLLVRHLPFFCLIFVQLSGQAMPIVKMVKVKSRSLKNHACHTIIF